MGQAKVLVIEDSQTQALQLQGLLAGSGLSVILAYDGRSGLAMAQQHLPDVVLLDLQLPDMNGFEVCRGLKEACETAVIPVIMLTRHDDMEAIRLGMEAGVVEFIPKDAFANAVLLETLRQMGLAAI